MSQLSPSVVSEIDRQVIAVRNRLSGKFPQYRDDIFQEAWKAAAENVPRYDPTNPGARGFFYRVALLHVSETVTRWASPSSISQVTARQGIGAIDQYATPIEKAPACALACAADQVDAVDLEEMNARLASIRVRWQRAIDRATTDLPPQVREAGAYLRGTNGPRRTVPWVARHMGLWHEDVARARDKFRNAVRRAPGVAELELQIEQLEQEIP